MEKLGIEHLKVVVKFGVDLGSGIDAALKDGKIGLADAGSFYAPLMELPAVIGAAGLVVPEAKDLDENEIGELSKYAIEELHIAEVHVVEVIQHSIKAAVAVFELVSAIKAMKASVVVAPVVSPAV